MNAVAAILVKDNIDKKQNLQEKTKNITKKANESTIQETIPLLEQEINQNILKIDKMISLSTVSC